MFQEQGDSIQRWTTKRRLMLILNIVKGETSVAEAARTHGLTVVEVEEGRDWFLMAAENALRTGSTDEETLKDEQIKRL